MKIAITSTGPSLNDNVEARFGRCPYFLIIDTDTMQLEAIENPNMALGGGAGIQSAQLMSEKGVTAVLTGNCGPNAFNIFSQVGIQVIVGINGTVNNAVEQFKAQTLSNASEPNVASHFGMNTTPANPTTTQPSPSPMGQGSGMGGGMGSGMGRGMGRGMGMGSGMGTPMNSPLADPQQSLNIEMSRLENSKKLTAVVDPEKCTGCGTCATVCLVNAITVNEKAVVNSELCIGCTDCVSQCPNAAITIAKKR